MNITVTHTESITTPNVTSRDSNFVVVAVDMGSEFTKLSYWNSEEGCSNIIQIDGADATPTAIAYSSNGEIVIGKKAIERLHIAPKQVILHFPTFFDCNSYNTELIHEYMSREVCEVSSCIDSVDLLASEMFHIISGDSIIKLSLITVCSDFLTLLRTKAEQYLGKQISTFFVVSHDITPFVKSLFMSVSTKIEMPIELISTATSLCLSYGFFDDGVKKTLLLLDFGWDAIRAHVVINDNNKYKMGPTLISSVLCGRRISYDLKDRVLEQVNIQTKSILRDNYVFKNKVNMNIYQYVNRSKNNMVLQKSEQFHHVDNRDISLIVNSPGFSKIITKCLKEFDSVIYSFLESINLSVDSFDDVLISGGIANCKLVYDYIQSIFVNTYFPDLMSIYNTRNNANESISVSGAAIQCASWIGVSTKELQSLLFIDLLPHDICMKTATGYEVVIPKGSSIPTRKTIEFELKEYGQKNLSVMLFRKKMAKGDQYIKLGQFDFKLDNVNYADSTSVGVTFTVSENGGISAICNGSYEPDVNMANIYILVAALIILTFAYLFLKIHFRDSRIVLGGNQYYF